MAWSRGRRRAAWGGGLAGAGVALYLLAGLAIGVCGFGLLAIVWLLALLAEGDVERRPAEKQAEIRRQTRALWWQVPLCVLGFGGLLVAAAWAEVHVRWAWLAVPCGVLAAWPWFPARWKAGWVASREFRTAVFTAAFFFVLSQLPGPHTLVGQAVYICGILVLWGFAVARSALALKLTRRPVLSGDHERAMRRLRWVRLGFPTARILALEGTIHTVAGRREEAVRCYRRALAKAGSSGRTFRDETLCQLGLTLDSLGRDSEARECLERVVAMGDTTGCARGWLAATLLERGAEAEKALALIDGALTAKARPVLLPGRMAVRAWALAVLGRQLEMDEAIAGALRDLDPLPKVVAAGIHLRIGRALGVAERAHEAMEHFRAAIQVHPGGECDSLARRELERLVGV